jgi:hypothetical protein
VQHPVRLGLGLQDLVAIRRRQRPPEHERGVEPGGGPLQHLHQGALLDGHGADEDSVGLRDRSGQDPVPGDAHVQVHQLQIPVVGQVAGEGQQTQWGEGGLPADEPHHVPVAPEGVPGELRYEKKPPAPAPTGVLARSSHARATPCAVPGTHPDLPGCGGVREGGREGPSLKVHGRGAGCKTLRATAPIAWW